MDCRPDDLACGALEATPGGHSYMKTRPLQMRGAQPERRTDDSGWHKPQATARASVVEESGMNGRRYVLSEMWW